MFVPWKPSYSRESAVVALSTAETWRDALERLGVNYHGKNINTLRKWAEAWDISVEHLPDGRGGARGTRRYTREEAAEAIASSFSWVESLRKLGMCHSGGNWKLLKRRAAEWGISSDHFDPRARSRERSRNGRRPLEDILVEHSTYSRSALKDRLYEAGLKKRECEMCGQGEVWRGNPIGLILDHINGVRDDNRLENLRIVCPNCAAGLETHCGRKNRIDVADRECLRCSKRFRPKSIQQRYCSHGCGVHSPGPRGPRPAVRKAERPPLRQLLAEIEELGYTGVGCKYGVSDNAIRKWVRAMMEESGQLPLEIPTRTWPNKRR